MLETQFGSKVQVFGLDRLKIVEWVYAILRLKDKIFREKLIELDLPKHLLEIMRNYYTNSNLHQRITQIFTELLQNSNSLNPIISCDLPSQILGMYRESKNAIIYKNSNKVFSKPFIGHAVKIANILNDLAAKCEEIKAYLKKVKGWNEFTSGDLENENRKNVLELGGKATKLRTASVEKEDPNKAPTSYSVLYQMLTTYNYSNIGQEKQEPRRDSRIADLFESNFASNNYWRTEISSSAELTDYS